MQEREGLALDHCKSSPPQPSRSASASGTAPNATRMLLKSPTRGMTHCNPMLPKTSSDKEKEWRERIWRRGQKEKQEGRETEGAEREREHKLESTEGEILPCWLEANWFRQQPALLGHAPSNPSPATAALAGGGEEASPPPPHTRPWTEPC